MAVKLLANYSKKIGLPQYSSHSFMASVEVELTDLSHVESECQRLYGLLQEAVDTELQQVGFLPGSQPKASNRTKEQHHRPSREPGYSSTRWRCTEGQRGLILRLINEHQLRQPHVEDLCHEMFNMDMRQLDKKQASQFIDALLAKVGRGHHQPAQYSNNPQTLEQAA